MTRYVLDPYKTPVSISFPVPIVTVVADFNGPGNAGISGGDGVFMIAGPIKTGTAIGNTGGELGLVGGFAAIGGLDPNQDLSKLFTKTVRDGMVVQISYQDELNLILADHPGAIVLRGIPTGRTFAVFPAIGDDVPGGGLPPYFQEISVLAPVPPQKVDLFQETMVLILSKDNPTGMLSFGQTRLFPNDVAIPNSVVINGYDKPVMLEPQSNGTIKVTIKNPEDGMIIPAIPKWTFSKTEPSKATTPKTITFNITKKGVG